MKLSKNMIYVIMIILVAFAFLFYMGGDKNENFNTNNPIKGNVNINNTNLGSIFTNNDGTIYGHLKINGGFLDISENGNLSGHIKGMNNSNLKISTDGSIGRDISIGGSSSHNSENSSEKNDIPHEIMYEDITINVDKNGICTGVIRISNDSVLVIYPDGSISGKINIPNSHKFYINRNNALSIIN